MHQWNIFQSEEQVAQACADFIAKQVNVVLQDHKLCHIALAGGNTPARCLQLLAQKPLAWDSIHWYLTDERCFPVGHAERNDVMVEEHFWSRLSTDAGLQHRIPAELGPSAGAQNYTQILDKMASLDMVLLGMGEDGHTASLFPDNPAMKLTEAAVPVYEAPKPPPERISLSVKTLQAAKCRIVLAMGENKKQAIQQIKQGRDLPVNTIGGIHWFIDFKALENG